MSSYGDLDDGIFSKNFPVINEEMQNIIASFCEELDSYEIDTILAIWASVNLSLLAHNKDHPYLKIQKIMNRITISQNECIKINSDDLN